MKGLIYSLIKTSKYAFATIWNPVFASCMFAILHWVSPWHLSWLYYLSAFWTRHVPSMPYGNFCMHVLLNQDSVVLGCVGCFKDTAVTLLQIECQDPQQYGVFSHWVWLTWNCENLGKEREERRGREERKEKKRGKRRREEPLDWPLETDTVKSQPWHFN